MNVTEARRLAKDISRQGPRQWAKSARLKELEDLIVRSKDAYYNSSTPIFPDDVFDELVEALEKRKPKSAALGTGARVRDKVALPVHVGSLNKAKDSRALAKWVAKQDVEKYVIEDKLDGISFLLYNFTDADGVRLCTRGDGREGQDISAWLPHLDLPIPPRGFAVRGELIMSESRFKQTWAKHAANARNLVSGLVNRNTLSDGLKDITAIAYELIPGRSQSLSPKAQLNKLKKLGYRIPKHVVTNDLDFSKLSDMLAARRSRSQYAIDGLVITANVPNRRPSKGNPAYAIAFKRNLESDAVQVKVLDVVWRSSRHGRIKPRVQIEPTRISGVVVEFPSGHNARFIEDNKIGPGAIIKVVRSGDVIPYITEIVKPARRAKMPDVDWEWDGQEAVIPSGGDDESNLRAIEFFFSTMGIEGIKYGTITKLARAGYDTLSDIVRMPEEDMVDALGQAGGRRLLKGLDDMYEKGARVDLLMAASGVFPGIGKTRLAQLFAEVPNVMELKASELSDALSDIPGWGESLVSTFEANIRSFKRFVEDLEIDWYAPGGTAGSLTGEVILFTGFRDAGLAREIEDAGGRVAGNWSQSVTVLVTKDGRSTSSKAKAAKRAGVPIVSPDALRTQFMLKQQ